jgi:hypothetical protein
MDMRLLHVKNPDGTPFEIPPDVHMEVYGSELILASPLIAPVRIGKDLIARPLESDPYAILPSVN